MAKCRYCGREVTALVVSRSFCCTRCESAYYKIKRDQLAKLMREGHSEDEARQMIGFRRKRKRSADEKARELTPQEIKAKEREEMKRRLEARDAAYAREFPDCVGGAWRGQRRIGMFSGLRKAAN